MWAREVPMPRKPKPIEAKPETPAGPAWVATQAGEALVAGSQSVAHVVSLADHDDRQVDVGWTVAALPAEDFPAPKRSGRCTNSDIATAKARVASELRRAGRADLIPA